LKDEDANVFWKRSSFKTQDINQDTSNTRNLSYKDSNKSMTTALPSEAGVATPTYPEDNAAGPTPTLNINSDTKNFTDYYSFPPITLIDDLEVWDDDDEDEV
jgi:hypothetical protein